MFISFCVTESSEGYTWQLFVSSCDPRVFYPTWCFAGKSRRGKDHNGYTAEISIKTVRMQLETTFCPDIYSCYLIIVILGSNFKPFDYSIDRYTSVVHTRIRLDACALNYHLHRIGIKQSPACSCGFVNESKSHYFLNCPNYAAQRQTLLTCAACIAPNLWSRLSDKPKTELFIFGSSLLSDEQKNM